MIATTYQELLDWLFALEARKGMDFKLERVELVLQGLGHPERKYPVIHIAGTNGKGSVAAMLHAMAGAAGLRAGLYTSPHLVRFTERIRVGEAEICPEEVVRLARDVHRAATLRGIDLTFFEFTTVLAFQYFADCEVPLAVIETGLGGRLDATNVVVPEVAVITSIGFDHQEFLGRSLASIAAEKAGIIKPGVPVVVGRVPPEAEVVILQRARAQGARVWRAGTDFDWSGTDRCWSFRGPRGELTNVTLALRGWHQCGNAAVAVAAAQALPEALQWSPYVWRAGLEGVHWPGRLEVVGENPLVILDGAHNLDGVRALLTALPECTQGRRVHLLFGVMADKDWPEMVELLAPHVASVIVTRPLPRRSADPERVASVWRERTQVRVEEDPRRAFEGLLATVDPGDAILVTGSLFLVGAVRSLTAVGERAWEGLANARAGV
ncbi:MAG: bifunctional folylpolyglutamate synthase/dihydrofolate synthase [Candidatus Binatia bacterium]|nr:bifunctional folylpolyglutamate synthase/dihydrofolate synthase [Candidatus Binatia bacterium]